MPTGYILPLWVLQTTGLHPWILLRWLRAGDADRWVPSRAMFHHISIFRSKFYTFRDVFIVTFFLDFSVNSFGPLAQCSRNVNHSDTTVTSQWHHSDITKKHWSFIVCFSWAPRRWTIFFVLLSLQLNVLQGTSAPAVMTNPPLLRQNVQRATTVSWDHRTLPLVPMEHSRTPPWILNWPIAFPALQVCV